MPYPYAIDKENNYYLLTEDVSIQNISKVDLENINYDPYKYYYDKTNIINNSTNIGKLENIKEFYIDNDKCMLSYCSRPKKIFKNLKETDNILKIILKNGEQKIITEKEYINIIKEYGKYMKFKNLLKFKLIYGNIY